MLEPVSNPCVCSVDATTNDNAKVPMEEKKHILWDMVCSCHEDLSDIERESLFFLLLEFSDIFAEPQNMPGHTSKLKHFIDTGVACPIRQPM